MYGNNRSHSLRATRRRWNVNLQKATIMVDGKKTTVRISTSALRTLRKNNKGLNANPVVAPKEAEVKPVEEAVAEVKPVKEVKPVEEVKPAKKAKAAKAE